MGEFARGARRARLAADRQYAAAALGLADDLARLIDDMTTRQVAWRKLDGLVPDDLDEYWQLSLRFLKIARDTGRRGSKSAARSRRPSAAIC